LSASKTKDGNLRKANLAKANLSKADLQKADLREANLCGADLTYANLIGADLRGALLDAADFSNAKLSQSNFFGCELLWTDLTGADLNKANFAKALVREVELQSANLRGVDFTKAVVTRSDLRSADLTGARFFDTELDSLMLTGAKFSYIRCTNSRFCNLDLQHVIGLETVHHSMPSSIGVETITLSQGKIPKSFLQGVGVPKVILDYILSAGTAPLDFYSCFVSYSTKDEFFAKRLYFELLAKDVRCWLFDEDAKWGEKVWSEIDRSINLHDKVIVVCSVNSLQSEPVLREIERALQREDKEKRNILFPVRIDDYIFAGWEHPRKSDVTSKVVGDFRNSVEYEKSFRRLLESLNKT